MDDIVKQALAKWPNVPDCYGWLGLDARGDWYMRDDVVQAAGDFATSKGSKLLHEKLIEFIGRNYDADAQGRWFFQNGPQRVYVELEVTPWVWRMQPDGSLLSHTHAGWLYLETDLGFGLMHSMDMLQAVQKIESEEWLPQNISKMDLQKSFGYCLSPCKHQTTQN
ncbi:MAG: hypothetical protein RL420_561 [Pseudomonadota bacterium]